MTVRGGHLAKYLLANESMNEPVTPFPLADTAHAHLRTGGRQRCSGLPLFCSSVTYHTPPRLSSATLTRVGTPDAFFYFLLPPELDRPVRGLQGESDHSLCGMLRSSRLADIARTESSVPKAGMWKSSDGLQALPHWITILSGLLSDDLSVRARPMSLGTDL